jgi:hypothetical protein
LDLKANAGALQRVADTEVSLDAMSCCSCELCQSDSEAKPDLKPDQAPENKDYTEKVTTGKSRRGLIPLALYAAFRKPLWLAGICQAFASEWNCSQSTKTSVALEISSPLVIQALLRQITDAHQRAEEGRPQATSMPATIGLAITLFVILQAHSLFSQDFHQRSMLLGVCMRSAVCISPV